MLDRSAIRRIEAIGGQALIDEMVALLLANVPQRVGKALQASSDGDFGSVQQLMHSLKSSAGNVGASAMGELCARIEALVEAGQVAGIPALLVELKDEWQRVKAALEQERKGVVG